MLMKFLLYGVALCVLLLVIGSFFGNPSNSPDRMSLSIECNSPYHAVLEWEKDGQAYSDEIVRDGKYFLPLEGENVSIHATAWKVNPTNVEDKLSMRIVGKKLYKSVDTYYPQWDLELDATGSEDKAILEGDDK